MTGEVILRAEGLVKHYPIKAGVFRRTVGHVKALDGVSFDLHKGETLGIVGESGCGKSTLGRMLMRLEEPTAGKLTFDGVDMYAQEGAAMRRLRRDIQIVFQDPYGALDPRMRVADIVAEPLRINHVGDRRTQDERVAELLELVGLGPEHAGRYPHQFSGGQRQRIGIARALAMEPEVLVLDEPVSALDVSLQAQVINLLNSLKARLGISYVFISHDLSMVRYLCDTVAVMYSGQIMETGPAAGLFADPRHPYTQALMSSVPIPDPSLRGQRERIVLEGDAQGAGGPQPGCVFVARCFKATDKCRAERPSLASVGNQGDAGMHLAACHYPDARNVLELTDASAEPMAG